MNNEIDVKIERILAIKEILTRLIDTFEKASTDARRIWTQEKIDSLIEELKHED